MSSIPASAQSFHARMYPMWRSCLWFVLVYGVLNLALEALAQYQSGRLPDGAGFLDAVVDPLVLGALLTLVDGLVVLAYPVRVLPQALRCFNVWGVYRTVKWGDIQSVTPASLMGLRYLKVGIPAHASPLTVPLWLRDLPGFIAAVEQQAGSSHLLTQALHQANASQTPMT
jgi:hypothetical protein